ncbi:kinase-like protein [Tricholoma matsutake]|nr:kinase-like protein [Tricholoma matsutake 945]
MANRRMKPSFSLKDIDPSIISPSPSGGAAGAGLGAGRPSLVPDPPKRPNPANFGSPFSNFSKIVDPSGALNFTGKAVLHAKGVNFSSGASFAINMNQLQLDEELGKGNYGTVQKVYHKPTNVTMAMKEIRLELDDAKLNAILMELDILHRAVAPEIVEFYGAFFIESCVYYCMEYMDAGSLDKLQGAGVPEDVLARIAASMVRGLKFLKDDLQIIHRGKSFFFIHSSPIYLTTDVKPTNVLVNRKGDIKLCDFGVSGQLEKSLAKTNIGCQSYMAPERIKGESQNNLGTYTVSSDVWSLGLSMIEIGLGQYPYPPETYANVFAQLTAIVHGEPPELPHDKYSDQARDWVARCLVKAPSGRATYKELLEHPFLQADSERDVDMVGWVAKASEYKAKAAEIHQDRTPRLV